MTEKIKNILATILSLLMLLMFGAVFLLAVIADLFLKLIGRQGIGEFANDRK